MHKVVSTLAALLVASASFLTYVGAIGAQWNGCPPGFCNISSAPSGCSQYTNFNARTSGMDTAHQNAFQTLICNLVTEGVFAKLDVMYVFATNSSGNAVLNLVSSSFAITAHGSPTFTADAGYTGTDASSTIYLDTGFNPTTATSPNFTQNSAHTSIWSNTSAASTGSGGGAMGQTGASGSNSPYTEIFPRYSTQGYFARTNEASPGAAIANSDGKGHYLANRDAANTEQGYKNAAIVSNPNTNSIGANNSNIFILAISEAGTPALGAGIQVMAATIGSKLTGGDVTNLCHELNTYLNTIAGIASGAC